mgnify:CR=1 FL=1
MRKGQNIKLPKEVYIERHHVFPRSIYNIKYELLGRKNNIIVKLTAKEHYVAHHLLWRYYQKKYGNKDERTIKMLYAFWKMFINKKEKITSRIYDILRTQVSELMSERMSGEKNHNFGKPMSEETKRKLSKKMTGRIASEETKQKLRGRTGRKSSNFGKHLSEETKRKISEKLTGKNSPMFGSKRNQETKDKMRAKKIGKTLSEETKQKIREKMTGEKNPNFGLKRSQETKQKMQEARKRRMRKVERVDPKTR